MSRRRQSGERHSTTDRHLSVVAPEAGRHRWVALAYHDITDTQASAASHGAYLHLRPATLRGLFVGCGNCNGPYGSCSRAPCPGVVPESYDSPPDVMQPAAPAPGHGD